MIFANNKAYGIVSDTFLDTKYIGYANLSSVKTNLGNTPRDATGIDKNKKIALLKCYHEHLERKKIGFQVGNTDRIDVINFIDKKIYNLEKSSFGYGYNNIFGYIDTTGTASGLKSVQLINTAILELIEKNEMLLFWYLGKGVYLNKNFLVNSMISKLDFSSERVEIFSVNELSNFVVFFVVLISNNEVIASGAGISNNEINALEKALNEARLLEWQNKDNEESTIYNMKYDEKKETVEYINYLIKVLPRMEMRDKSVDGLIMKNWIKSMFVNVLNPINDYTSLTIKCISKELYNCMPTKENIRGFIDKKISIKYGLDNEVLKKIPNCILK